MLGTLAKLFGASEVKVVVKVAEGKRGRWRWMAYLPIVDDNNNQKLKFFAVGPPRGWGTKEEAVQAAHYLNDVDWEIQD